MTNFDEASTKGSVDEIVEAVRQLQRTDGTLPSERALAERLQVKRHQLRKALVHLRETGDVEVPRQRGSGTGRAPMNEDLVRITNPLEILELRMLLEPGFARLASLRATALEIKAIKAAAATPADASSGEADLSFHLAVVSAARNHLAREFYKMLRNVGVDTRVRVASSSPTTCPKRIAQRDAEHRRIANAIAKRDPDAAEAAMREHLLSVEQQINDRARAFAA
ncbi:FadR/GntR family transcriptional regulator [Pseudohoeflea coraliihabitans]|uniref:FCD domain-containing protein n=1 Tax=Pseudohoeflea coraliihabitans TaxID=2860393 RepID=A0ABS6WQM2_9HYPH|nr:FCD domain-containing protein [Pseudohoeflea sp. DP4N28-3]MBW3098267.1 FCD domain-containing protein [Pseudohoeflea sp. DP4N28-3]